MKKSLFLTLFSFSTISLFAQTYFPEKNNWESKNPTELGLDAAKINLAIEFAETHESEQNPNLKIAHYESAFGRDPSDILSVP